MKKIIIQSCGGCPHSYFSDGDNKHYCLKDGRATELSDIHKTINDDCPLEDYPEQTKTIDDAIAVVEELKDNSMFMSTIAACEVIIKRLKEAKEQ